MRVSVTVSMEWLVEREYCASNSALSVSCTSAYYADALESFHVGGLAERAYDVSETFAYFDLIHEHCGSADCCIDKVDGAVF